MVARWTNPYRVLVAGYVVGAGIYLFGVFITLVWVFEIPPWKFGYSWAVLQPIIQMAPFVLLAVAIFVARCIDDARIVAIVVLLCAIAVVAANTALLVDWFISEFAAARRLAAFLRSRPGAIFTFLGNAMPGTAVEAMAKTTLLALWLALACIVVAILDRLVRWIGPSLPGMGDPRVLSRDRP